MSHLPRDHQFCYQTQYLFPLLWTPFTLCFRQRTIAYALETSHGTFLLALDIFLSSIRELLSATFPDVIDQIVDLAEVYSPGMPNLYSFISTMEFLKKGFRLHHDDLKQRNVDIIVLDRPLREEQARMRRPARFVTKPSPLSLPLKSRDEISCSGGDLWRPGN